MIYKLFLILLVVLKYAIIAAFFYIITNGSYHVKVWWIKLLQWRNRLIIRYVTRKRINYIRNNSNSTDPEVQRLCYLYQSTHIYNLYQHVLDYVLMKGGGNCGRCYTLTLPNMPCPKCGFFNTNGTIEIYHEDAKKVYDILTRRTQGESYHGVIGFFKKLKARKEEMKKQEEEKSLARMKYASPYLKDALKSSHNPYLNH